MEGIYSDYTQEKSFVLRESGLVLRQKIDLM